MHTDAGLFSDRSGSLQIKNCVVYGDIFFIGSNGSFPDSSGKKGGKETEAPGGKRLLYGAAYLQLSKAS